MPLTDNQSRFHERPMARFMRGDIRMKQGKLDEALPWFENFLMQPATLSLMPWTYQRRAQIYEKQGRLNEAAEYYNKFVLLYDQSDAHYQPFVEEARERRDAIIRLIN